MKFKLLFPEIYYSAGEMHKIHLSSLELNYINNFKVEIGNRLIAGFRSGRFNKEWNEVYGNTLSSMSILCLHAKDKEINDSLRHIFDLLLEQDSFSIIGGENDEMNISHIIIGMVSYLESLQVLEADLPMDKVALLFRKLLNNSMSNEISNWYCNSVFMHNHCFWLLLMRIILSHFLISYGGLEPEIYDIFNSSVKRFEMNLEYLACVGDGSFYEGASYGTYTATAICLYLIFHFNLTGERSYSTNKWIRCFPKFIEDSYFHPGNFSFSKGDAPINWTSGPEFQIKIFESYCFGKIKSTSLLGKISEMRAKTYPAVYFNRSVNDFINLNYADNIFVDKNYISNDSGLNITKYDTTGVFMAGSDFSRLYINYGAYGGELIKCIPSHNIGHSYPSIGGVTYVSGEKIYIGGALYQKPKLTAHHPVPVFLVDGLTIGQIGSSDHLDDKKSWLNIADKNYPNSQLFHVRESSKYSILCIPIKNYNLKGLDFKRYVIFSSDFDGVFMIDVFLNGSIDGLTAQMNYPLPTNDYLSLSDSLIANEFYLKVLSHSVEINIDKISLECHGDPYTLINRNFVISVPRNGVTLVSVFVGDYKFEEVKIELIDDVLHFLIGGNGWVLNEKIPLIKL